MIANAIRDDRKIWSQERREHSCTIKRWEKLGCASYVAPCAL
jgi:hypothetical protein